MEARDPELKKELDATLRARGEPGPEYEPELIDSFLERLDGAVDRRVRRQLAEQRMVVARGAHPPNPARPQGGSFGERFGFSVASLVAAVPLSAIGVANTGLPGLVVSWLGILGVNAVHASGRAPWSRRHRHKSAAGDDAWD